MATVVEIWRKNQEERRAGGSLLAVGAFSEQNMEEEIWRKKIWRMKALEGRGGQESA